VAASMASPKVSWQYQGPRGAVAQLGERQLCKLDVVGSIPISSMKVFPAVVGYTTYGKRSLTSAYEGRIKDFC
jgi:hypothetical protein